MSGEECAVNLLVKGEVFVLIIAFYAWDSHASWWASVGYGAGEVDEEWVGFVLLDEFDDFVCVEVFDECSFVFTDYS